MPQLAVIVALLLVPALAQRVGGQPPVAEPTAFDRFVGEYYAALFAKKLATEEMIVLLPASQRPFEPASERPATVATHDRSV